jgi:hypothetical protein
MDDAEPNADVAAADPIVSRLPRRILIPVLLYCCSRRRALLRSSSVACCSPFR